MTDRYGIVGHPVAHSLSPAMHNAAFRALGIEASYEVIDLEPEGFEEGFRALAERGFRGVNVTVPHKESVLSLVDELDPVAKAIGAVNTITFEPLGIAGTNTDADGLARSLEEASVSLAGSKVVVLGAGGAA
ncbi:MAG: shikimate dehydrogenase (NADP+), partial [Myxococcales bacterium]|nr:shikimate dehydrogenase (NADP+) [Myxococcales bacterium]